MMTRWRRLTGFVALLCGTAFPMGAWAANEEFRVETPESQTLECLTRVGDKAAAPTYPEYALSRRLKAEVKLEISFATADEEPVVRVVSNTGWEGFATLAMRQASSYRLPCMSAEAAPLTVRQVYVFDPFDGRPVNWSRPEQDWAEASRCFTLNGKPFTGFDASYPTGAIREGEWGRLLVQMVFLDADRPPEVHVLFGEENRHLSMYVKTLVDTLRAVCLKPGKRVKVLLPFNFSMEGTGLVVLKDLSLAQFVRLIGTTSLDKPENKVRFDLSSMGCPFDVRFKPFMPFALNTVGEVGVPDERRKPLLNWIAKAPFELTRKQWKHILGEPVTVSVPCGTLDLT